MKKIKQDKNNLSSKVIQQLLCKWQPEEESSNKAFNQSFYVKNPTPFSKERKNNSPIKELKVTPPTLKTRTPLKNLSDRKERDLEIKRLADEKYFIPIIKEFFSHLEDIRTYNELLLLYSSDKHSLINLNNILKGYKLYNNCLQTLKELDDDIFVSRCIKASRFNYSPEFSALLLQKKMLTEQKENYQQTFAKLSSFTDTLTHNFSYTNRPLKKIRIDEPFGTTSQEQKENKTHAKKSFQHIVETHPKLFIPKTKIRFTLSSLISHSQTYQRTTYLPSEIAFILYSYDMYNIFEITARTFAKIFIETTKIENKKTGIYLNKLYSDCFKPIFIQTLKKRRIFNNDPIYNAQFPEEKEQTKEVIKTWDVFLKSIKKTNKHKSVEWKEFVKAINDENLSMMEEKWNILSKKITLSEDIMLSYFDFKIAFCKRITPLACSPRKKIPLLKSQIETLIHQLKRIEFLQIRSLLKWVLKSVFIEFQTNVTMPMIKTAMKAIYEESTKELKQTENAILLIHKTLSEKKEYVLKLKNKKA